MSWLGCFIVYKVLRMTFVKHTSFCCVRVCVRMYSSVFTCQACFSVKLTQWWCTSPASGLPSTIFLKRRLPAPTADIKIPTALPPQKQGFVSVLRKGLIWLVGRVQTMFASQTIFGDFGFIWSFYLSLGNVSWLCRYLLYYFCDNLASFLLSFIQCLEKFPVIQHFKFGSLLSIQPVKPWHTAVHAEEISKSWQFFIFLCFLCFTNTYTTERATHFFP